MEEVWKDIESFEGLYQVSNQGRVRSLTREVRFGPHTRMARGKMLSLNSLSNGYPIVILTNGVDVRKTAKIHRLVAEAFIPNPDNLATIDHINNIKTDNRVENLRWCSNEDNVRYAWEDGLRGPVNPDAIRALAERTAKPVVRSDGERFKSVVDAARAIGVTDNAVHAVLHGRNKTCRGYTFVYA